MKKMFLSIVGILASSLAIAATTVPVQLLNPTGSSSGQTIVSSGASSAPGWGSLQASAIGGTTQYNVAVGGSAGLAFVGPSTSGYVLTSNGGAAYPSFQPVPAATGSLLNVQVFTASGTYTPTSGAHSDIACGTGGGGGGGGAALTSSSQVSIGGSGVSGSWGCARITSLSSQTVTIGAAGAAGPAGGNPGGAGGTTSIGTWLSCPGGGYGQGGAATAFANTSVWTTNAGQPATCTSSGTLLYASPGNLPSLGMWGYNGTLDWPAPGGSNPYGAGGWQGSVSAGAGANGTGHGAGGSGAICGVSCASFAGGTGSGGILIVYEYQ